VQAKSLINLMKRFAVGVSIVASIAGAVFESPMKPIVRP
jgi:hypothetical protein